MNEELIKHQLGTHEKRLNNYGQRLDRLEQDSASYKVEIKNLCDTIKSLTSTLKWFMGLMVGAFVSFFFYAVQQGIFK